MIRKGEFFMKYQAWECINGCGIIFLINKVSTSKWPHKPPCPNCHHKETVIHEIDLEKTEIKNEHSSSFLLGRK